MSDDTKYGSILFIVLFIICYFIFSEMANTRKLHKDCQETALNRGYPEYKLIIGDTVKCYGTSKDKSELLYEKEL